MFEAMTFEAILAAMLAAVEVGWDKREGSVIYSALAPAAAQLAQLYLSLDAAADRGFLDTAAGADLDRKAAERGLTRYAATCAVRAGTFANTAGASMDVAIGRRFSGGGLTYAVTEKMETGVFRLACETAGTVGNTYFGALLPLDYISGLGSATLADVLIAGEDGETDSALRARYLISVSDRPFGGNIADYKEKAGAIAGVGGVKVTPAWNGGGTVKLTLLSSDLAVPSAALVAAVQAAMDPAEHPGEGVGLAPIGHAVTVEAVSAVTVTVTAAFTLETGYVWADLSGAVETAIAGHLTDLAKSWADGDTLTLRVSRVEQAALSVPGIEDVQDTKLNGAAQNLALGAYAIPVLGTVTAV